MINYTFAVATVFEYGFIDAIWNAFWYVKEKAEKVKRKKWVETGGVLGSHAGVFRELVFRISFFPTNSCSTQNNIPFPSLANRIVPSKVWKVDLDRRVTDLHETLEKF